MRVESDYRKMDALKEVNANLVSVLSELEAYVFVENIDEQIEIISKTQKTKKVEEIK